MVSSTKNAIIYCPTKSAMQSGKGKTKNWILEFEQSVDARSVDFLMGWTGSSDMLQEFKLKFPTLESAVAFADSNNIKYKVVTPNEKKLHLRAYADNFTKPIKNPLPKNNK